MLQLFSRAATVCAFALMLSAAPAAAQSLHVEPRDEAHTRAEARAAASVSPAGTGAASGAPVPSSAATPAASSAATVSGNLFGLDELRRQLREQREEIELLRATLGEQARALEALRTRVERAEQRETAAPQHALVRAAASDTHAAGVSHIAARAANAGVPVTVSRAGQTAQGTPAVQGTQGAQGTPTTQETQTPRAAEAAGGVLAPITFSGDLRLRYESFYGQQNALASAEVPGALGNPLSTRQRLRLRARLAARGRITDEFEWGLRFATGNFPDVQSANQTLTDFFSHKNFALDQAFLVYKPKAVPGLQLQGGKFEAPWWRTELAWDGDNQAEGLAERYTYRPRKSKVREVALLAWQLPFLERNAAFVLGPDGQIDFEQSRRGGRDLALYGGQARVEIAPSENSLVRLAVADHLYSGTQFINPAQFFGANVQFPVTINLPATADAPARSVTGQVSIPRDLLVSGSANLGISAANTNALNRDGRLASGFNLLDFYGQLELNRGGRWPLLAIVNYMKNTHANDFFAAGEDGASVLVENDEDQGVWAEFQVGRDLLRLRPEETRRGDALFNYTYILIEKDAVLTPFNFNDLVQQSDVRAHRLILAYAVEPRVALSLTALFSRRAHGLLGPFVENPPGSLNRTVTRLQFDTIFRF